MKPVVVGTRGSRLALIQTDEVVRQLRGGNPQAEVEVRVIRTGGDRSSEAPISSLGLGVFVKEIEEALLRGEIDMAVHSLKDLPSVLPEGLTLGALCRRADPRDVLVNRWDLPLAQLPPGARIGTSSPRRAALVLSQRPDLEVKSIRGNVDTRLKKAKGPDYDGAVLAAAGLQRLGLEAAVTEYLDTEQFVPAPGQGALAVEVRRDDEQVSALVGAVDHLPTRLAVTAERAFLERLGSGCQVPAAAYAQVDGDALTLHAVLASPDGRSLFRAKALGRASNPHEAAAEALRRLIDMGASSLLSSSETR